MPLQRELPKRWADDRGVSSPADDDDEPVAIVDDQLGPDGRPL